MFRGAAWTKIDATRPAEEFSILPAVHFRSFAKAQSETWGTKNGQGDIVNTLPCRRRQRKRRVFSEKREIRCVEARVNHRGATATVSGSSCHKITRRIPNMAECEFDGFARHTNYVFALRRVGRNSHAETRRRQGKRVSRLFRECMLGSKRN